MVAMKLKRREIPEEDRFIVESMDFVLAVKRTQLIRFFNSYSTLSVYDLRMLQFKSDTSQRRTAVGLKLNPTPLQWLVSACDLWSAARDKIQTNTGLERDAR